MTRNILEVILAEATAQAGSRTRPKRNNPRNPAHVQVNPWLIAVTVSLATFMEVMDTSIANVALRHIAGSLAAGQSESTWVLTSFRPITEASHPLIGRMITLLTR